MAALKTGAPDVEASRPTRDALFGGKVVVFQPPRGAGYRVNVDAILLAGFAAKGAKLASLAFDLGAGVGAVGLSLLKLGGAARVVLVEIDETLATLARRNIAANGWSARGEVAHGDVRDVGTKRRGEAALVVCNPPYLAPGRGRVAPSQARARSGELGAFVEAARQVAGKKARVCFVYPAQELGALLGRLAQEGLHAKRLRLVHASVSAEARIALVEARAGKAGGLHVSPPMIERDEDGACTPELRELLEAR